MIFILVRCDVNTETVFDLVNIVQDIIKVKWKKLNFDIMIWRQEIIGKVYLEINLSFNNSKDLNIINYVVVICLDVFKY